MENVIEALTAAVNSLHHELKSGMIPDSNFYNGRLDGLFIALKIVAEENGKLVKYDAIHDEYSI